MLQQHRKDTTVAAALGPSGLIRATNWPIADELATVNAKIAAMRGEIRELQAKLKVKVEMPKDVIALQQQLTAKTELRNLKLDRTLWRQTLDKARSANPVTMTKAQFAVLQKAFHPDPEHDTATPERNRQLNAAAAVFNALKFRELTGHDQDCHYQKILAQASIVATQTVARLSVVPRQGPCPDAPL